MGKSNPRDEPCLIDGCDARWHARKLCPKHLRRLNLYGSTDPVRPYISRSGTCSECPNPIQNRGLCSKHYARFWSQTDAGRISVKNRDHRRRAIELSADRGCWYAREQHLALILNDPCSYCGSTRDIEIEHIAPISKSFDDSWSNLATACRSCNASKSDKSLLSFLLDRG